MQCGKIIDTHNHIYKAKIAEKAVAAIGDFYDIPMRAGGTPEDLLLNMKKSGIYKAVVHSAATRPAQVASINNFIYEEMNKHPEFIGFGTLHPELENMEEEIERMLQMGFKGIKIHPDFQEFAIDSPAAIRMYELLKDRFIILFHTGDPKRTFSQPQKLARVLELFPNMKAIAAHMGGYSAWEDARQYLYGKNVYIDTSSTLFAFSPEEAAQMIHEHGTDKVLFGTDYPMWTHEEELEKFMRIPLSDDERYAILYGNAAKLLQIN